MTPLKSQAIQTALHGDWQNAILLNIEILKEEPNDIDTMNRLAFAYASTGDLKNAKDFYTQVLELDVQNPIATKNLKRLSSIAQKNSGDTPVIMNNIFIEEPGKTKVIELLNTADKKITVNLNCGEHLLLSIKRSKIFILDSHKQYVGMLPDDISRRLIEFIAGGNNYDAYVKIANQNKVVIFIRETKKVAKFKNQQSFTQSEKSKLFDQASQKRHDLAKKHEATLEKANYKDSSEEDEEESSVSL